MEIVPVIDLKNGVVVRARLGRRDEYRPIETPLAKTSDPIDVAQGLLGLHPFRTLYVADLDAIEGRAGNEATLRRLRRTFPGLSLWVDNGISDAGALDAWLAADLGQLVLGSETQRDAALVRRSSGEPRIILSLDFRGDVFQGPPALLDDPSAWPKRVIGMTLARVGSGAGPDLDRLAALLAAAPDRELYAAGGVRGTADLRHLVRAGVAGALVASCLHDGRLTGPDIAAL